MEILFQLILFFMSLFLILLVLVQRGRGGGLAGALGGPGGSSAFGAKAGDTFTRITIYAVSIWIVICVAAAYWANHRGDALGDSDTGLISGGTLLDEGGVPPAGDNATDTGASTDEGENDSPAGDAPAAGAEGAAQSASESDAAPVDGDSSNANP